MGQKIHPLGFRLGITQNYRSQWFSQKEHYPQLLAEDQLIRKEILKTFPRAHIASIKIKRHLNLETSEKENRVQSFYKMGISTPGSIVIEICALNPEALVGIHREEGYRVENFSKKLTKKLAQFRQKQIYLNSGWNKYPMSYQDIIKKVDTRKRPTEEVVFYIKKVTSPHCQAFSIAHFLVKKLEKRQRVRCNAKFILRKFKKGLIKYRKEIAKRRKKRFLKLQKYLPTQLKKKLISKTKHMKHLFETGKLPGPSFQKLFDQNELSKISKYFEIKPNQKNPRMLKRIGVKVQLSGRLNGAEIARTLWSREGRVPLQTLKADIDYSYQTARTIYGLIGIKVWIYRKESKPLLQGHIFPFGKQDTPLWVPSTVYNKIKIG